MDFKFKKLSDVELVSSVSDNANVLIEEDGQIKKVDNPAFILNKPTSLGGYAYYATYGSYITKCEEPVYPSNGISRSTVTIEEFISDYKSKPIMLMVGDDRVPEGYDGLHPLVNCVYNSYYTNRLGLIWFDNYTPTKNEINFVE